jgi:RNA recognition motif-containing protein
MLGSVSVGNAKDLEIFVGGLPKDCTEEDVTVVFSQFGEIASIIIKGFLFSCPQVVSCTQFSPAA